MNSLYYVYYTKNKKVDCTFPERLKITVTITSEVRVIFFRDEAANIDATRFVFADNNNESFTDTITITLNANTATKMVFCCILGKWMSSVSPTNLVRYWV